MSQTLSQKMPPEIIAYLPIKEMYFTNMSYWGIAIFFVGMGLTRLFAIIFKSNTYLFEDEIEYLNWPSYELPKDIKKEFWSKVQKSALKNKVPKFFTIWAEMFETPYQSTKEENKRLSKVETVLRKMEGTGNTQISEIEKVKDIWWNRMDSMRLACAEIFAANRGSSFERF